MTIALDTRTDQALLPRKARRDLGREARTRLPVDAHGELAPSDRDPISVLERQAESRVPSLIALRHSRMASSAFAFYRGAAAIMADDLRALPFAVGLSRAARGIIRQNLWASLGMVAFLIPATIFGFAKIGVAVALHEGSTLLVVANALRLLAYEHRRGAT